MRTISKSNSTALNPLLGVEAILDRGHVDADAPPMNVEISPNRADSS